MNYDKIFDIILRPYVSEKAGNLNQYGQYVFRVHRAARKKDIATAVEKMFSVQVESVRMLNVPPQYGRTRFGRSKKPGWKKAYVHLAEGQTIDLTAID